MIYDRCQKKLSQNGKKIYDSSVSETKPIPVRLASAVITRLDAAAKRMGTNRSALMKFLVQTFVENMERRGMVSLPHDWEEIMRHLDGRTYGQQARVAETPEPATIRTRERKPARYSAKPQETPRKPKPKKPKP